MTVPIGKTARKRYALTTDRLPLDIRAARAMAQRLNEVRPPDNPAHAGEIAAQALLDTVFDYVVRLYERRVAPQVWAQALAWLESHLGQEDTQRLLETLNREFAPADGPFPPETGLEMLILIWLANENPARAPYRDLFDDTPLRTETVYQRALGELHAFFDTQPPFGPEHQNVLDMLRAPIAAAPDSLEGQLEYVRTHWGYLLGDLLRRLLTVLDVMKEERKGAPPGGRGPAQVPVFGPGELPERYSPDRDWMPNLVLLAKNTYVWLDQLSKKYGRPITRLDQIPDEELDTLARWGFTGLWLIGLWERSPASAKIKHMTGNPDAIASAYSVFDYFLARDLGGEEAMNDLQARAWQRGIRIASDMVPNHMGIDSTWVMEHPDWFISVPEPPFPAYTFNGPDLSWNPRVGIYLEDHYYDRTDAAVVFKRVDRETGDVRYIYHGNDGTSMPWNDTAQLDFLKPEVREVVIQTIIRVAKRFPIIRFDAAMVLTKMHYQRLWYPEPGTGGAIPSRAEHGMTKEEFDRHMPREFWREVVDRVAQEAPDTLLLAEAFWLLEGYFVRVLGMHRVYNSAFMNMLRDEENAKYRQVMKNTLEFDPQILKRFVNFMNNPDEEPAVVQFGKGDKYFGICTMMVTLPGLPMFGHGQIEGFAEKYGMEFRRAYWDEQPDPDLIARHEREIFPLMRRRYLFAEVDNFTLYDVFTPEGHVNEDVFAYSNRAGEERALVVYHNRFAEARGWIKTSVAFAVKEGGEKRLVQRTLGEALALPNDPNAFVLVREHISGLEYIYNARDLHERGWYVELGAYRTQVFLDFRIVHDEDGTWRAVYERLGGRGVPSLEEERERIRREPVVAALRDALHDLIARASLPEGRIPTDIAVPYTDEAYLRRHLAALARVPDLITALQEQGEEDALAAARSLTALLQQPRSTAIALTWAVLTAFDRWLEEEGRGTMEEWWEKWDLRDALADILGEYGDLVLALATLHRRAKRGDWLADTPALRRWLGVHDYQGVTYFRKEPFEMWVGWAYLVRLVDALAAGLDEDAWVEVAVQEYESARALLARAEKAGWRWGDVY